MVCSTKTLCSWGSLHDKIESFVGMNRATNGLSNKLNVGSGHNVSFFLEKSIFVFLLVNEPLFA